MAAKIDHIDARILQALQRDSSLSQRALAEAVGISQNACWRRLQALDRSGVIGAYSARLDRQSVGLGIVAFAMIRTRHHSKAWLEPFRQHVTSIPEVIDFFRVAGDYDYILKIVARDIANYDRIYQRLIDRFELDAVTSYFAMEAIAEDRPLPVPETR
jgi:Lrp/AsnC family transcriptional regulator